MVWDKITFIIDIPESLLEYDNDKLNEIFEFLEKEYNVESYIEWNNLVVNADKFSDAANFLDDNIILGSEFHGRESNYSLIIWNEWLTPNFLNISEYFINELFEILTENILDRYNNEEYWFKDYVNYSDEDKKKYILYRYNNTEYWCKDDIDNYFDEEMIKNYQQQRYIMSEIKKKTRQ